MMKLMTLTTEEKTTAAVLAALCMFLSVIEYLIPKPLPFMRLGLANLPVLVSLAVLPGRGTVVLVILKIMGQGLVNGTLFSYIFIFSAAGSIASCAVMISVYTLFSGNISMMGISVLGALAGNMVQITAARYIIFGNAAYLIAPPFLVIGTVSALVLGFLAEEFIEKSEWFESRKRAVSEGKRAEGEGV